MFRSNTCGELRLSDAGKDVTLAGWVQRVRKMGGMTFVDLRDRYGITQIVFNDEHDSALNEAANHIGREFVVQVKGTVAERTSKNPHMPTGDIEILANELRVLNPSEVPPFTIEDDTDGGDDLRMRYRYLDLRRGCVRRNLELRHRMTMEVRRYLDSKGFLEIETPMLVGSTPEGARDFVVPSRMNPGQFYALPQSPQTLKQLLMVSGMDRYFQIVKCFRDEDLRADRQPEFTQIDCEMSYVEQEDVISLFEGMAKHLFKELRGVEIKDAFPRMTWADAMKYYGSDKPDLRFGFEIKDLSSVLANCGFKVFAGAIENKGSVRGINIKGGAKFSRKEIDSLTEFVKTFKAKGLAWYKNNAGEISSSYAKFLTDDENAAIVKQLEIEDGDLALIVADKNSVVFDSLGALRCEVAKRMGLVDPNEYKILWITEFPLFEYSEEDGRYYAKHHPFTMPMAEDIQYLETEPERVRSIAYDIVINGTEAGGGSIRIHTPEIQNKMFHALGFTDEEANDKFGFLLEAFKYGTPPHGGLAFGLDRLVTLLLGLEDIRDVIAFPKVQNASELMTKCPTPADPKALEELGIAVTDYETQN